MVTIKCAERPFKSFSGNDLPSSNLKAKPGKKTLSIKPFKIAGGTDHQVGYTKTRCRAQRISSMAFCKFGSSSCISL